MPSYKPARKEDGSKVELIQNLTNYLVIIFNDFEVVVQVAVVSSSDFQQNVGDADAVLIK